MAPVNSATEGRPPAATAPATISRISAGLLDLGVEPGDLICLHVSLSSLGFVAGGARAVIEGAIDAVGGDAGTVMMPSYSGDLSDPAEWRHPPVPAEWIDEIRRETPAYDPEKTPTRGMGAVAEYFRGYPGTQRSEHPQSSFAARGRQAAEVLHPHPLDNRFGPDGPLGRLAELGGKVLLLGAPYDTVSLFHMTQHLVGRSNPVSKRAPVREGGATVWADYRDIDYPVDWFEDAVLLLLDEGIAATGSVCGAHAVLMPAGRSVDSIVAWRRETGR